MGLAEIDDRHQFKKEKETGKMFSLIATIGTTAAIEWLTSGIVFGISAYAAAKETTK